MWAYNRQELTARPRSLGEDRGKMWVMYHKLNKSNSKRRLKEAGFSVEPLSQSWVMMYWSGIYCLQILERIHFDVYNSEKCVVPFIKKLLKLKQTIEQSLSLVEREGERRVNTEEEREGQNNSMDLYNLNSWV